MKEKVGVVVAMSEERRTTLVPLLESCVLEDCEVDVFAVSNCEEAQAVFEVRPAVHLLFTSQWLPDGNWRTLLVQAIQKGLNPQVVVCSPTMDGGWTNLLERGAWGLLAEPYSGEKIQALLALAGRQRPHPPNIPPSDESAGAVQRMQPRREHRQPTKTGTTSSSLH